MNGQENPTSMPQTDHTLLRRQGPRKQFLGFFLFIVLLLGGGTTSLADARMPDASSRKTLAVFSGLPCLTGQQRQWGRQVIPALGYTDQRLLRRFCQLEDARFPAIRSAIKLLLKTELSFEQVETFELWSSLSGVTTALALEALPRFATLSYEAGRAFRAYLQLPEISPRYALKTIPLLTGLKDANNRAVQGFLSINDMNAAQALNGMITLARLVDHQALAADRFARIPDMTTETMLDALPLIRQLRQEDAWNASWLFRQAGMTRIDGWLWIVRYFALPPMVQEAQYYLLDDEHKKSLLQAFYDGGEELIWKINNLHAITDRFGFEIPDAALRRQSVQQLYDRYKKLSNQTRFVYGKTFYPALRAKNRAAMIRILKQATRADRIQTGRDLSSANIYALLSQGSELYDSSFRDILVPILKKRIRANHHDDLLTFLHAIDPGNKLVSSFIVSLAQKGKLTTFFPEDQTRQRKILELVATSAFASEDSILLFSATFTHLLKVLQPEARTWLIEKMSRAADQDTTTWSRLISVILQYYLREYPELLSPRDRMLITRLIIRKGAIDLDRYQQTPFAEWKADGKLASLSIFHPDDDGRKSFVSNARTLQRAGYRLRFCRQYTLEPMDAARERSVDRLITEAATHPGKGLVNLFRAMQRLRFSVAFVKNMGGIEIRHAQYVYSGAKNQQRLLRRFLRGGDEMLAQRGHSYWRSEQITEPLIKAIRDKAITTDDLENKQRFLSLGSCGGVKAYTRLTRLFKGKIDILATIGTGMAIINNPYNKNFFEVVATSPDTISWKTVADRSAFIFKGGRGQDYLQPGSLTAILHKIIDEDKDEAARAQTQKAMIRDALCPEENPAHEP